MAGDDDSGGYQSDNEYANEIVNELGLSWDDVLVDMGYDDNPDHYRPGEYSTPEEALIDYYERGLGDYIEIYYDEDCDCYQVYLSYEE